MTRKRIAPTQAHLAQAASTLPVFRDHDQNASPELAAAYEQINANQPASLPSSIAGSKVSQALSDSSAPLAKWMQSVAPFVDFDSSRFAELTHARRQEHNWGTATHVAQFTESAGIDLDNVFDFLAAELGPVHYRSKYTFRYFAAEATDPTQLGLYVIAGLASSAPIVIATGCPKLTQELIAKVKDAYQEPSVLRIRELTGFTQQGPMESVTEIVEGKLPPLAHDSFYPFLKMYDPELEQMVDFDIERFTKEYNESSAHGLVLIGPPGTGKSVLARTMMIQMNRHQTGLAAGAETTMHPGFVPWIKAQGDNSLTVIEDADVLVGKRTDGNHQMSGILNHLNGITSRNTKLVISTNLPDTEHVDPALLRIGRNYATLVFGHLRGLDQINAARANSTPPVKPIPTDAVNNPDTIEMTLSEALNWRPSDARRVKPKAAVGFISGVDEVPVTKPVAKKAATKRAIAKTAPKKTAAKKTAVKKAAR